MYIDSYNEYHKKMETTGYQQIKCKWFSVNTSGYKYAEGVASENYRFNTPNNPLKYDLYNMYVKSEEIWCFCSPCATRNDCVCAGRR